MGKPRIIYLIEERFIKDGIVKDVNNMVCLLAFWYNACTLYKFLIYCYTSTDIQV